MAFASTPARSQSAAAPLGGRARPQLPLVCAQRPVHDAAGASGRYARRAPAAPAQPQAVRCALQCRARRHVACAAAHPEAEPGGGGGAGAGSRAGAPPCALLLEVDGALTDLIMAGHRCLGGGGEPEGPGGG
jgi:hypothetical protein